MNKKLYVDFDGIISKSKNRVAELYNKKYKSEKDFPIKDPESIITWDCGLSNENCEKIFSDVDFYNDELELHKDSIKILNKIKKRGYEIILLTKGGMKNLQCKLAFITNHKELSEIFDGWIFSGANELCNDKNRYKLNIPLTEGFSVLLDDNIQNLKWSANSPTFSLLGRFSNQYEEWNQVTEEDKDVIIVKNWKEVDKALLKIENEMKNLFEKH